MEKQLKERIENICIRFGHAVTELDVLEWLENFSEGDRNKALTLLSVLNYYSFDRIIGCIKDSIEKIIADNPGKKHMKTKTNKARMPATIPIHFLLLFFEWRRYGRKN